MPCSSWCDLLAHISLDEGDGFPFSFFELGAWGDNRFHALAFVTDLAVATIPGAILAGYVLDTTDGKQSEAIESHTAIEGEET